MGQVNLQREVEFSAQEVWEQLKDFGNIHRILPTIGRVDLKSEHSCGMGAERVCYTKIGGFSLAEKVIDWKEGEQYTIDIFNTSMPLMRRSITTLGVKPISASRSEVFFNANYEVKYGWFGKVCDKLMMQWMMNFMISGIFKGIEKQIRSLRAAPNRQLKQPA